MATIFWYIEGILLIGYMKKGSKITRGLYRNNRKVENCLTIKKALRLRSKDYAVSCQLQSAQSSPSPLDTKWLVSLSQIKKHLRGLNFSTDEHLKEAVEGLFLKTYQEIFLKAQPYWINGGINVWPLMVHMLRSEILLFSQLIPYTAG